MLRKDDDSVLRVALDLETLEEETEKIGLKKEDALNRDKWRDGVRAIAEGMG